MTTTHILKAKSFSNKALGEIKAALPASASFKKQHVSGVGYVWYIYNSAKECIAHVYKDFSGMNLLVKS